MERNVSFRCSSKLQAYCDSPQQLSLYAKNEASKLKSQFLSMITISYQGARTTRPKVQSQDYLNLATKPALHSVIVPIKTPSYLPPFLAKQSVLAEISIEVTDVLSVANRERLCLRHLYDFPREIGRDFVIAERWDQCTRTSNLGMCIAHKRLMIRQRARI